MTSPTVVIAIPTYRRPALLARLLDSLRPELEGRVVPVVVADNDAGAQAPAVVAACGLDAVCVPVTRPGIAEVRNALVRTATATHPAWEWLLMLDDDGYVSPGWFEAMTTGARRYDADVAAGPVLGDLPDTASVIARNSVYAGRTRHPSGPVPMLNGAQNIAIRRRIVDAIGDPWFPVELGRAGGEDHYFFRSVLDHGGTLAWCDEAPVTEPTPASRLTAGAVLRRAYRSNVVSSQTDLAFNEPSVVLRRLALDGGRNLRNAAAGVVRRDLDRLGRVVIDTVSLTGRAVGLVRRATPSGSHAGD